jgi:hypothetical protein
LIAKPIAGRLASLLWKDGDLDREHVAEAERKLRGQT